MVAIKYAPTAAACLALCTAVGASLISERQVKIPAIATPNADDAQPGAFGGRAAAGNKPAKAADDPPPANTFAISGTVPGTLVVSNGNTTVTTLQTPGGDLAGLPGIDLSAVGTLSDTVVSLVAELTALVNPGNGNGAVPTLPVPLPLPVPGLPGVPSTYPAALLAQLTQEIAALQAPLAGLAALPAGAPVPSGVTDAAAAVVNTVLALPPSLTALLGGGVPSSPVDTIGNVVAFVTALIPLLTSLAALLPVGGVL